MKSTYRWVNNFQGIADNGRTHAVVMDLPPKNEGDDTAPTALEFAVMSLSGCIGTIYALMAKKMRLTFTSLTVALDAEKGPEDPTIASVKAIVKIKSEEPLDKLEKCLEMTLKTCPVGVLYEKAGIPVNVEIKKEE